MSVNTKQLSDTRRSKAPTAGVILGITLVGPLIGILLAAYRVVLAPPWTSLTGIIYLAMACLSLPLGIVAALTGWLRIRRPLVALIAVGLIAILYMTIIGPWMPPGGRPDCQAVEAPGPQLRYTCAVISSDAGAQEFTLAGRSGWPVMRMADSEP